MRGIIKILHFGFLLILLFSSCKQTRPYQHEYERKMKLGDNMEWAEVNFDDSSWAWPVDVAGKGIYWSRLKINLSDQERPLENLGVMIVAAGAYEAYWDGQYIGVNGRLATDQEKEIPGTYHCSFKIPDSLQQKGEHVLALRMTLLPDELSPHAYSLIGNFVGLQTGPLQVCKYMFMIAGAFLITAIYFFFVFANQPKEYSILIFGVVCLAFFGLIIMEYLKHFYFYQYPFQFTRLVIIGYLHNAIALLIPLFFMIQFSFPWKKLVLGLMVGTIIFLEWYYHFSFDFAAWANDGMMWIYSILIVVYACFEKKKGAYIVLIGLGIGYILPYVMPYFYIPYVASRDVSLFLGFVLILLLMLYIMTLRRREERLAYEASLVLSERLKNELLKKNIKPHFIMNTLTSLIDWVEESPKEGVKFINALADEFEVLNQIADYKQIPIEQEIKLCRSHLKVMGYRKEVSYKWEEENIDLNEIIPPAIIHTAVENGVTHSLPDENGNITFRLIYKKTDSYKQYTLQTIAKNRPKQSSDISKVEGGTGQKYIKARLQESYGNGWKLKSNEVGQGWETVVKILT